MLASGGVTGLCAGLAPAPAQHNCRQRPCPPAQSRPSEHRAPVCPDRAAQACRFPPADSVQRALCVCGGPRLPWGCWQQCAPHLWFTQARLAAVLDTSELAVYDYVGRSACHSALVAATRRERAVDKCHVSTRNAPPEAPRCVCIDHVATRRTGCAAVPGGGWARPGERS